MCIINGDVLQFIEYFLIPLDPFFTQRVNVFLFRGKVCKFCLYKRKFRLGEDIVGTFDFTVGEVRNSIVTQSHCAAAL